MIAVAEKYAIEVNLPVPITSERQHQEYVLVLDELASKKNPTNEEEKYAQVLMTLIEAYDEDPIPDASPVVVLRALMEANDLRQKAPAPIFGSECILSEMLHNKRALNKARVERLSERFHVSRFTGGFLLSPHGARRKGPIADACEECIDRRLRARAGIHRRRPS